MRKMNEQKNKEKLEEKKPIVSSKKSGFIAFDIDFDFVVSAVDLMHFLLLTLPFSVDVLTAIRRHKMLSMLYVLSKHLLSGSI